MYLEVNKSKPYAILLVFNLISSWKFARHKFDRKRSVFVPEITGSLLGKLGIDK